MNIHSDKRPRKPGAVQPGQYRLKSLFLATFVLCVVLAAFHWSVLVGGLTVILLAIVGLAAVRIRYAVALVVALLASAFLLYPAFDVSPAPIRPVCNNNLKCIALALQNYHDTYKVFPPPYVADEDGQPMHSWRVLILPFLEQQALYAQYRFDEPWYGPNNRKLAASMPSFYRCPNSDETDLTTDYVAVVGANTVWPTDKTIGIKDVTDGTSNTAIVVESTSCGIHWMEPNDLQFDRIPMKVNPPARSGINSGHPGGALVAFVDGSVQYLQNGLPAETINAVLMRNDGQKFKLD